MVRNSEVNGQPCLIISGSSEEGVLRARHIAVTMLQQTGGLGIDVHPHDVLDLRQSGCKLLAEIEQASGCRISVEDAPRVSVGSIHRSDRQHIVQLFGDQEQQARALQLLGERCKHPVRSEDPQVNIVHKGRATVLKAFDEVARGLNVELSADNTVAARSQACAGDANPSHCIAVGHGTIPMFKPGAFFCFRVRKVCYDPAFRGGTRLGISTVPVDPPLPDTLLVQREGMLCWAMGRGLARGPDNCVYSLPAASLDLAAEGDTLGVLVTGGNGAIAVFHKRPQMAGWNCLVHWDAGIPTPASCYALLELSGRIQEVELVTDVQEASLPHTVSRKPDFPAPPPAAAARQGGAGEVEGAGEVLGEVAGVVVGEALPPDTGAGCASQPECA